MARAKPTWRPVADSYTPTTRQAEASCASKSALVRYLPQYASVDRNSHTASLSVRPGSSSSS